MEKRGQVTVFIILGVIIVIVALTSTFLRDDAFRDRIENVVFKKVVVPEQAQGVVNFVNGCVETFTIEGVDKLGALGGYIDIPRDISENPVAHLKFSDDVKIPYWLYGQNTLGIPSVGDMENDLENYIEGRFRDECSFEAYEEQGYFVSRNDVEVSVKIDSNGVNVDLDESLDIRIKGDDFGLKDYVFVHVPTRLMEFHGMGRDIVRRELENAPFEFTTLNLISIYGHHPDEEIPPLAGLEFECGDQKWFKPNVKEVLKDIIEENTVRLRVEGSDFEPVGDVFYDSMVLDDVFDRPHSDVSVRFNYFRDWDFFLDISPSKGLVIEGDTLKLGGIPIVPIFCLKNYDFRYDINYPLLVEITDGDYVFRYPIEVVIKDNYGRERQFDDELNIGVELLICDDRTWTSGDVHIDTWDAETGDILEDVDVIFGCAEQFCTMGKTELNNGISEFNSRFPQCKEGDLRLSKEGYLLHRQPLPTYIPTENPSDPAVNPSQSVSAVLEPFRNRIVSVKVLDILESGNLAERDLSENEVVIVQLNRYNSQFNDVDYRTAVTFEGNVLEELDLIPALSPDIYQVQITLVSNEFVTIPEYDLGKGVIVPALEMDGGLVIGGGAYEWTLDRDDLDNNDEIVFYALSKGIPEDFVELQENLDINDESLRYSNELKPILVKNE